MYVKPKSLQLVTILKCMFFARNLSLILLAHILEFDTIDAAFGDKRRPTTCLILEILPSIPAILELVDKFSCFNSLNPFAVPVVDFVSNSIIDSNDTILTKK